MRTEEGMRGGGWRASGQWMIEDRRISDTHLGSGHLSPPSVFEQRHERCKDAPHELDLPDFHLRSQVQNCMVSYRIEEKGRDMC